MPELAVEAFEMVDVDEHESHVTLVSPCSRQGFREIAVQLPHVPKACQRIVGCKALLSSQRRGLNQRRHDVRREPHDEAFVTRSEARRRGRVDQLQEPERAAAVP